MRLVLIVIFTTFVTTNARNPPIVKTNYGRVRGKWLNSARDISIASYLGIPYAEPPIDDLRFESPKPWKDVWTDIRDVTEDGSMCVQLDHDGTLRGDENCLNLNIFVPLILPKRSLPVMVFIHGGGFNKGSNNSTYFAPDYLVDQEVVLVTVNYRLNIFGFLSTATENVPGNAGLKDIIEALKWVQRNIIEFGGDPNSTTLIGQSAGAAAVHHLALSQTTEGLFDKYITHSGSALAPWAIHSPFLMRMKYLTIAKELGCTVDYDAVDFAEYLEKVPDKKGDQQAYIKALDEDEKILKCLREMSPTRLVNSVNLLQVWKRNPWCNLGPTVEVQGDDAIITKHPFHTITHREFRDIPWITGVVQDEGLLKTMDLFLDRELMDELIENFSELGTYFLESQEVVSNTSIFIDVVTDYYFPEDFETAEKGVIDYNLTQMAGDGLVTWPTYMALNYQALLMNSSIYYYLFSYDGTFSVTFSDGVQLSYGVAHFDDMNYLFPCLNNKYADLQQHNTGSDWTMVNIMTEMWTNFARDGVPRARKIPNWKPYHANQSYMRIGSGRLPELTLEQNFLPERMEFWEEVTRHIYWPLDKYFPDDLDDDEESDEIGDNVKSKAAQHYRIIPIESLLVILTISTYFIF